eukprot:1284265-Karenia_brevis.AAC.1
MQPQQHKFQQLIDCKNTSSIWFLWCRIIVAGFVSACQELVQDTDIEVHSTKDFKTYGAPCIIQVPLYPSQRPNTSHSLHSQSSQHAESLQVLKQVRRVQTLLGTMSKHINHHPPHTVVSCTRHWQQIKQNQHHVSPLPSNLSP